MWPGNQASLPSLAPDQVLEHKETKATEIPVTNPILSAIRSSSFFGLRAGPRQDLYFR